ncbi:MULTISPECIES: hypothetical protein [unclassified Comamonas]|uniref:hypothetical protein n=1 Tax=unclassified Comamonas TaxID=2638500 RepID=UPI001EFB9340|nr:MULTISPECIES: hypothetical protein [unclassified Comamonas]ULR90110.1 hypothetical protein MJ205_04325 [Comamonas sp. B21-038]
MPLVVPTPIPAYPPAPQPTDDRVSFSTKAFALAASYEPQRVAFNIALDQVHANSQWAQSKAQEAQDSAMAASQSASNAHASRVAVDEAVNDVREALDAIKAGPVASVNGRNGVVVGLQEALIQRVSTAADNGQPLLVGSEYALSAGSAYSRSLPVGVAGNQIVLNSTGGWAASLFTLGRANAAHTINGVADNVLFDSDSARRIIASCTAPGAWTLTIS